MGRRSVVVSGHSNRYGELSHDLQSAIDRLLNAMASARSDEVHTAMVNSLRKEIIQRSSTTLVCNSDRTKESTTSHQGGIR